MMVKFESLAALLIFLIKAEAKVGSGRCRGGIVDVFVESSYMSTGRSSLDPDTFVQVKVTSLLFQAINPRKKTCFSYKCQLL